MTPLTLLSPAKLNLFLRITGRRDDGYHELQTLFQLLDYGDAMSFSLDSGDTITLSCNLSRLETENNLVLKAARLLQQHCLQLKGGPEQKDGLVQRGANIQLDKRLPLGGGVGGGSSNAATTLLALNRLWDCGLSLQTLAELGLSLGADVPVFIHGRSAWAEGLGQTLTSMPLPERWYVVLTPSCHADTRQIFCHEQLTRDSPIITIPAFPNSGAQYDYGNDCEEVACLLYPEIRKALEWLQSHTTVAAIKARMTGTGASVFAAFDNERSAREVLADKPGEFSGFVARGIDNSPVHEQLGY